MVNKVVVGAASVLRRCLFSAYSDENNAFLRDMPAYTKKKEDEGAGMQRLKRSQKAK